jgi:hypothetical protein
MRKIVLLALGLVLLPVLASAQEIQNCPNCSLGLYDLADLNQNCGTMAAFTPKDLYLGVNLSGVETGITLIEFSIAGMRTVEDGISVVGVEAITSVAPTVILGDVKAPADTAATSTQLGGMNVGWAQCIAGTKIPLMKITILSLAAVNDKVFRVMHRFAPSNPNYGLGGPIMTRCDNPIYTAVRIKGGYYIANPSATPPLPCTTAVQSQTWSAMKGLYR